MNELALGKENLKKALLEVSKNYLENLELAPAQEVHYSQKLEQKMAKLLKTQRKPYRKLIDAPYKKAIAACLTLAMLVGTLMSCKPIREPVLEFFTGVCEKFTEFFFGAEDKEAALKMIEEVHTLTYVPEGYELVESPMLTGKDYKLRTVWMNMDGEKLVFQQALLTSKTTMDTEDAEIKIISNNTKITIVKKRENTYIFWNNNQYAYILITEDLSEMEIEKIINSFFENF